jgi:L-aminopeptidase/D-esterase-like protein
MSCFRLAPPTLTGLLPVSEKARAQLRGPSMRRVGAVIDGFGIGHATVDGAGWLTGTTVVLAREGAVGGVDVRGGGPGTRETDLLSPLALIEQVDAVVLTGGSAYGLAAADGVMSALETAGQGFRVGPHPGQVVPIVPAAVIFDLGRGGDFSARPTAQHGRDAFASVSSEDPATGCVGAGTGATCGPLKGGFGYAETMLASGVRLAAAVVVNARGSAVDPVTGRLYADRKPQLSTPTADEQRALNDQAADAETIATTIGVLLTDAQLTKAQANKLAAVGHDGMARAINPIHTMLDGDTVFCLASGVHAPPSDPREAVAAVNLLIAAAADVFADACLSAVVSASTRGPWPSYAELVPSAFRSRT